MKSFINRPIPRLLRYELLLKGILEEAPEGHEDRDAIPELLEVIKALGKETEPGVSSAKQKVELWKYNTHLVFKPGESVDMDLLDENRSLIHAGKLLRQPESGFEWSGWSELFVLLFDNYRKRVELVTFELPIHVIGESSRHDQTSRQRRHHQVPSHSSGEFPVDKARRPL